MDHFSPGFGTPKHLLGIRLLMDQRLSYEPIEGEEPTNNQEHERSTASWIADPWLTRFIVGLIGALGLLATTGHAAAQPAPREPIDGERGFTIYQKLDEETRPLDPDAAAELAEFVFIDWYDERSGEAQDDGRLSIDASVYDEDRAPVQAPVLPAGGNGG